MTIPDPPAPDASFALLASPANFACEVLQALIQKACVPELIVLPEYPPAASEGDGLPNLVSGAEPVRLLQLAQNIEIAYAPAARQAECAILIEGRGLEYLLVACWPYLIEPRLIESASRAALNLHPSLLPKYRGPNPLQQQLAAEDPRFGTTLHRLDQRFDHGDIIAQAALPDFQMPPTRTVLEQYCARLGAELFVDAIGCFGQWEPVAQTP
ncbi:MAG: formyltransferase family protein [Gammaproteobacteria bacterium]|nr:formyltransferase family protein [Gammaproteobacteria bacterium]